MKIVLDSEKNFSSAIRFSEADEKKSGTDLVGDVSALCACAVQMFVREYFELDSIDRERALVAMILESEMRIAELYYDDMSSRENE